MPEQASLSETVLDEESEAHDEEYNVLLLFFFQVIWANPVRRHSSADPMQPRTLTQSLHQLLRRTTHHHAHDVCLGVAEWWYIQIIQ